MRTIKTATVAGLVTAAFLAFAGVASAEKVKAETTVWIGAYDFSFGNFYIAGNVEATKKKCVADRSVELSVSYSDKPTAVVDAGITGESGAYGLVAYGEAAENIEGVQVLAAKSKIVTKKNGKTIVCGKDFAFIA